MSTRREDDPTAELSSRGPVLKALVALLGRVGSADHEDALMDAIVSVLAKEVEEGQRVGATLSPPSARRYALRVIQNRLLDEWRSRARNVPLREPLVESASDPDAASRTDGELELIAKTLHADMPDNDRALLDAYFTGRDAYRDEMARQGYTATTARGRIYGLLRRLRDDGRRLRSPSSSREP